MADVDGLPARLERLESRIALHELITRYCLVVDDRDLEGLAELFTADAWFDSVGGRTQGREALVEYYAGRLERYGPTYHIPHGQVVEFQDADSATGTVLAHAELAIDGEAFTIAMRYHDEYVREDGAWRFRSRDLDTLYAMLLGDLPDAMGADLRKRWPGTPHAAPDWPEGLPTYDAFVAERVDRD